MPSGADLEYQRMLANAGVDPANAQGFDAARLEQMGDELGFSNEVAKAKEQFEAGLVSDIDDPVTPVGAAIAAKYASKVDAVFKDKRPVAVRDYTTGNGVDDNTTGFASAVSAARVNGRPLIVGEGTYRVNPADNEAALTVTMEGALSGLTEVRGAGRERTILRITNPNARGIDLGVYGTHFLEALNAIHVSDLTVRGTGTGATVGIRGRNVAKGVMTNVDVDDFGSHGVDLRNCNSWNFHNLRSRSHGGAGFFGDYATSRDAADPGIGQAENNSANHALSLTGTCLFEDNVSHGITLRGLFDLNVHIVSQRNGSRGAWLQDVSGFFLQIYTEANAGDGVKLGNSSGGITTACKYGSLIHFAAKGAPQAANSRTALWIYAGVGIDAKLYTGSYTAAGDYGAYLETSFAGSLAVRHSGGSSGFIREPGGTNLPVTSDVLHFGSVQQPGVSTKTANYTLTANDNIVIASGAGTTITLPSALVAGRGRRYTVKRNDATNAITINSTAGLIDGVFSQSLSTDKQTMTFVSDGAAWYVV